MIPAKLKDKGLWKDAARLAIQSAVAAAAIFTIMQKFDLPEKFVGVLSAVLVVSPGIGSTLGQGKDRFLATLVGCVVGIVCLYLLPGGYGTAVALAVSMLVMNAIAGFFPDWRYGVVAAVALALGSDQDLWTVAKDRSISIGLGVVVGLLISVIVWPEKSSHRAEKFIRRAIESIIAYLEGSVADALEGREDDQQAELRGQFLTRIENAKNSADNVRIADNGALWDRIRATESTYHAVTILDRVREPDQDVEEAFDDRIKSQVKEIQELAAEILEEISEDGKTEADSQIEGIRSNIEDIRTAVFENEETEGKAKTRQHALVFAINEIEDGLTSLIEVSK